MSRGTLDCPVCGDGGGFHEDDCGAGIVVPGAWKPVEVKVVREKVRLTDEEIAERRRAAAERAGVPRET